MAKIVFVLSVLFHSLYPAMPRRHQYLAAAIDLCDLERRELEMLRLSGRNCWWA